MLYKKSLTKEQALQKLKHYCAYQERCHSEVTEKLYSLGVWKKEHDEIISTLIEENYLNEERFAIAFAGGKFRVKQKIVLSRIMYDLDITRESGVASFRQLFTKADEYDDLLKKDYGCIQSRILNKQISDSPVIRNLNRYRGLTVPL